MTKSAHRCLAVLDAPSNLGLKPPSPGQEPGVKKMPGVLRAHGILLRLHAEDAGSVVPPAYAGAIDPAGKGADLIVNLLAEVFSRERREA